MVEAALEKLKSLNLPSQQEAEAEAIVKGAVREFSERVVREIGFAGKIALVPQEKYEYIQSNIRALTKVLVGEK